MAHFQDKLAKQSNELIRIIVGFNQDNPAWWIVQVEKKSFALYQKAVTRPDINLSQYGKVLDKGWGEWPDADALNRLEKEYGVKLPAHPPS